MTQHDPRYQRADKAIRKAFLSLFERKGIEEITASEIIRASDVNRSTFYAHYADKYELLAAIERDLLAQAREIFQASPTLGLFLGKESAAPTWEAYFTALMDFLYTNRRLLSGLINREGSTFMVDFSSSFAEVLKESGAVSRLGIPTNYEAALLAWATAGLVEEWARSGFADDRQRIVTILVRIACDIQETVLS